MPPVTGKLEGATQPNKIQFGTRPSFMTKDNGDFGPVAVPNGTYPIRVNDQGPSGVDPPELRVMGAPVHLVIKAPNYVL